MLLWIVVITTVAGVGGTGLGGVVSAMFRKDSKKTVSLLLSFAGGVMLAVVCFDLVMKALGDGANVTPQALLRVVLGIFVGFAVIAGLNFWIDKKTNREIPHVAGDHPKTADDLDELIHSDHLVEHKNEGESLFVAGLIMAAAIALHNLPEGVVIGAAYASDHVSSGAISSGLLMAIIIGLHNVPEGMAVAVPLIAGGMSRGKAIWITAISGAPTVLGAVIGYLLGSMGDVWRIYSLAFASGAMLYVVFGELLPESILMWRSKLPALGLLVGLLTGLFIIYV